MICNRKQLSANERVADGSLGGTRLLESFLEIQVPFAILAEDDGLLRTWRFDSDCIFKASRPLAQFRDSHIFNRVVNRYTCKRPTRVGLLHV